MASIQQIEQALIAAFVALPSSTIKLLAIPKAPLLWLLTSNQSQLIKGFYKSHQITVASLQLQQGIVREQKECNFKWQLG